MIYSTKFTKRKMSTGKVHENEENRLYASSVFQFPPTKSGRII